MTHPPPPTSSEPVHETPAPSTLHLFDAVGIELEYMLVDQTTLDVRPIADALLTRVAGETTLEVDRGRIAWSNELALHVIELKTNGPTTSLSRAAADFQASLGDMHRELEHLGARLMPTGMHPWMDPHRELSLWPHEQDEIYRAFDRIFDCTGHGWANLQSMHINLPFSGDEEFARLHAAIRLVLPLLPALAASSPFAEGKNMGLADTRLFHYRDNAKKIPSVSGLVVPERIYSQGAYEELLESIYRALAPHDPEGILVGEWVNARGAIARFDRGAIEIRVLDTQECPQADLSLATLVVAAVRHFCDRAQREPALFDWQEGRLARIFGQTLDHGDGALIEDVGYLALFGATGPSTAREVWTKLATQVLSPGEAAFARPWLELYDARGCLSSRIVARTGQNPSRAELASTYRALSECLHTGRFFA